MVKIIKKIIILMIIIQSTFIPISNALSLDEILIQGDEFLNEGKNNQYIYEYEIDDEGNILRDDDGNPIIKKDANGKPIIKIDEQGKPVTTLNQEKLKETVEQLYNVLLALGVGISVIVGAILGIRFMAGSVEEQAKIKEMLAPYVIGCIVVFGGFGIWKIVMTIAGSMFI